MEQPLMLYRFTKNDKPPINNYWPVSLLPILGKILERIIFDNIYIYLDKHNLLNPNQSRFRPKKLMCLLIIWSYSQYFDYNSTLETRAIFLEFSKAFDKVWHKAWLFKFESMGISGDLLNLMESFLRKRFQRVLLMVSHLNGLVLKLVFFRAQFQVPFLSWYTLMIFLMVSLQT